MTTPTIVDGGRSAVPQLKKSYSHIPEVVQVPNLILVQLDSFRWFKEEGLRELFDEISPIQDFTQTRLELRFAKQVNPAVEGIDAISGECPLEDVKNSKGKVIVKAREQISVEAARKLKDLGIGLIDVRPYYFGEPKYCEAECRERDMTYSAPLHVNVQLVVKESGEIKEQEIFMGDFPLMTGNGTFIINGAERVVVSQLVRSPGVYLTLERDATSGRDLCYAKLIPNRGAWLEFETSNKDVVSVKVDRKRKIPITTLLRAIDADPDITDDQALGTNERILALLENVDTHPDHRYTQATLERESCQSKEEALLEFYRRLRPGDPPTQTTPATLSPPFSSTLGATTWGGWDATSWTSDWGTRSPSARASWCPRIW